MGPSVSPCGQPADASAVPGKDAGDPFAGGKGGAEDAARDGGAPPETVRACGWAHSVSSRPVRQKSPETYDEKLAQLEELRQAAIHHGSEQIALG